MFSRTMFNAVSRGLLHPWFRLRRGLTLGVRCLAISEQGEVMLVRHTYAPGWLLPGGGVERGETVFQAAARELREETGLIAAHGPMLHGLFLNEDNFRGDHVACLVFRDVRREAWRPTAEIAAAGFFAPGDLPAGTTGGTRRRIAEVLHGQAAGERW